MFSVVDYVDSFYFQIICWVLGEYGTADGKYSASYIIGKLYDVAEAHPTDDTVRVCSCSLAFVPLLLHVAHCYCACSVLKYYNIDPSWSLLDIFLRNYYDQLPWKSELVIWNVSGYIVVG